MGHKQGICLRLYAESHQRGVRRSKDHAEFDDRGHKKMYDGESTRETEERREIPPGEGASWLGSEEMGDANAPHRARGE